MGVPVHSDCQTSTSGRSLPFHVISQLIFLAVAPLIALQIQRKGRLLNARMHNVPIQVAFYVVTSVIAIIWGKAHSLFLLTVLFWLLSASSYSHLFPWKYTGDQAELSVLKISATYDTIPEGFCRSEYHCSVELSSAKNCLAVDGIRIGGSISSFINFLIFSLSVLFALLLHRHNTLWPGASLV